MRYNRSPGRVSQPSAPAPSEVGRGRVQQQSSEDRKANLLHESETTAGKGSAAQGHSLSPRCGCHHCLAQR